MIKDIYKKLFLGFFVGVAIFYFLNLSRYPVFWMDEAWDISVAWSFINKGVFGNPTYPIDGLDKAFFLHPPLPILLTIPLIKLFGISPYTIHILPFLCGIGSILLLYLLVKKLFGIEIAFWSALFLSFNPLFFLMSRQLRPEIFVTFFTILSFYLFNLGKEKKQVIFYFLAGVSGALSFLSHYYGAFLIGTIGLYLFLLIFKEKSKLSIQNLLVFVAGVVIVIFPFFVWIFRNFEIFKIQFLINVPNLTGINKIIDSLLKEKERYLEYPQVLGVIGFTFFGLFLFFKELLKKVPEAILFLFLFLLGLALFMPNKTLIYFTPILILTALIGSLMLNKDSDFFKNRFSVFIKIIALMFLLISVFYVIKPENYKAYFKSISFNELKLNFGKAIERYYQTGKIVGDPTYFLFLDDNQKEKFISEHVLLHWLKEKEIEQVFKEENITCFVYSPYWWQDHCKLDQWICDSITDFLKNKGKLLTKIERSNSLVDYLYLIKND